MSFEFCTRPRATIRRFGSTRRVPCLSDGRARGTGPGGDGMKKSGRHYYNVHVRTRPVKRELAKGIRERG